MKTIYDPCPAGYKVPPQDVYGAFLKNPVIEYVGEYNNQTNAYIQKEDFYPYQDKALPPAVIEYKTNNIALTLGLRM